MQVWRLLLEADVRQRLVIFLQLDQMGDFNLAGAAPRSPEIEDDDFVLRGQFRQLDLRAVQHLDIEIAHLIGG